MKLVWTWIASLTLFGCGGAVAPENAPAASTAHLAYAGAYEVPVPAHLKSAALYPVEEIEWNVVGSTATLSYKLPAALIGREVRVEFTGAFDSTAGTASLVGPAGTAECIAVATNVWCHEVMPGLHPVNADLIVVEQLAAVGYAGPTSDRVAVTKLFSGDPIGIAHIDLTRPLPRDAEGAHEIEREDD